ncbi:hypothetical protein [Rhizobium sp. RHZ01]|uniref:hypothetical protein n=1 Tax=Rhizobium sp. RHZ01 TaxID=2769304 RepID=UPI0017819E09|nr:hypothetical protein [Rhizobium sp. RHZ01]MBD9447314.1 hypothetical protein [Rhizobium sp. RHZ01]
MNWIRERVAALGTINRLDIMAQFRVSSPTASADLQNVQKRWPDLLEYDKTGKRYVAKDRSGEVSHDQN